MTPYVNADQESPDSQSRRTPLPAEQLAILLLLRFAESASNSVIAPFLKELISSVIGGDDAKVGYYVGSMETMRQALSLLSIMYWSRLSDYAGRKPILLLGTMALAISTASFANLLVCSRCIFKALNSNAGVIKCIIGEITDHTNSADAFALFHVPWAVGGSFGAVMGGLLARPHDHFPNIFSGAFWVRYPYFLPCAVMASISIIACFVLFFSLDETVKHGYFYKSTRGSFSEEEPLLSSSSAGPTEEPVPFKSLLQWKTVAPVLNYAAISSLETSFSTIQPIFLAMPVEMGGLALPPRQIGTIVGTFGIVNGICQTFLLGKLVRRFGVKAVFVTTTCAFLPLFLLSPITNLYVTYRGFSSTVWMMLVCQYVCLITAEMGYGCMYIFITASAPNIRSLGATNGFAQSSASMGRTVAPIVVSSLLSFSIERKILWGYASYATLIAISLGVVLLACQLPRRLH